MQYSSSELRNLNRQEGKGKGQLPEYQSGHSRMDTEDWLQQKMDARAYRQQFGKNKDS